MSNCEEMLTDLVKTHVKTVLITGASQGLGFETALGLALKNYKVIMADKVDLSESIGKIQNATGNENIVGMNVDFASLQSTREFAQEIKKTVEHLDVLIHNAGVFCLGRNRTCDGLQAAMHVNHFAPFLLSHLLKNLLIAKSSSSPSRVLFTTSTGAFFSNLTPENLNNPDVSSMESLNSLLLYYNTKLCNMITSRMLAQKLSTCNVTCNCFHPGMTGTDFMVKTQPQLALIPRLFLQSAARGAQSGIFLASSQYLGKESGKFFVDMKEHQQPSIVNDRKFCEEIWKLSEFYVDLKDEEKL